jgi:lipoprotein-releasing system ATP-binding protein
MIEVKDLHKNYGQLAVLKGVSTRIEKGEVVAIVGPSGAGKSTLLQILGTLDQPDKGQVLYNNTDVFKLNDKSLAAFRNKDIGFVFQFHHLLPEFTALENLCIPAFIAGEKREKAENRAKELADFLQVDNRLHHKPSALSGGEQQRFAVARALMLNPTVVLADEPSGNLDTAHAKELHQLFFSLRDHFGQTFIIVTHNESLAKMADRRMLMTDGKLEL